MCLLFILTTPIFAQAPKKATDETQGGMLFPKIVAAWFAYSMPEGWTEAPYPTWDDGFGYNLFVKALFQGQYKLYHLYGSTPTSDPADYYTVGYDGPLNPDPIAGFTSFPKLDQSVTLTPSYLWDSESWGFRDIKLFMNNSMCYAFKDGSGRKYKFLYDERSGAWDDIPIDIGLNRVSAEVSYKGNTVTTNKGENAVRICVRHSDYTTPNAQRTTYVNWLFAYLHTPYQYGGTWYGGKTSDNWVAQGSYTGYGIDCSALVSAGAKWAGYNWTGGWRKTTIGLVGVSTTIFPENEPFGVGDILNKPGSHVVTVIGLNGNTVNIIEAAGEGNRTVTYDWANRATNGSQTRVVSGAKLEEDYTDKGYVQRRLVPHQ
jgi:hypothetical protein